MNKNHDLSPLLFSRKEAATFLGKISLTTLDRLGISRVRIKRRVFYRRTDIEKWVAKQISKQEDEK
jgi:hypothetical protein